jgi:hypothetical protein
MAYTLCTKEAVQLKAGANAATLTDPEYTALINAGIAFVCAQSRENWIARAAAETMEEDFVLFFCDTISSHAAISVINHDMSGFTSRTEAQVMLDVLYSKLVDNINLLRDDKFRKFIIKGEVE